MHKPLPMTKMNEGVVCLTSDPLTSGMTAMTSPALDVMTDLHQIPAITVRSDVSVARAVQLMLSHHVRMLLVTRSDGTIEGLLTARDAMGEKPITLLQESKFARYEDLIVADLMVPRQAIDVLDIEAVRQAEVGSVIATLQSSGHQHALVVEHVGDSAIEIVRGIFSASHIARQIGIALPMLEVAATFAEITSALEK